MEEHDGGDRPAGAQQQARKAAPTMQEGGCARDGHAADDRQNHQIGPPLHPTGRLETHHAQIVHGRHAGQGDQPRKRPPQPSSRQGHDDGQADHRHSQYAGPQGQADVIGPAQAGGQRLHGQDMGHPGRERGDDAGGDGEPPARLDVPPACQLDQLQGRRHSRKAEGDGEQAEPPVVTVQDRVHRPNQGSSPFGDSLPKTPKQTVRSGLEKSPVLSARRHKIRARMGFTQPFERVSRRPCPMIPRLRRWRRPRRLDCGR